MSSKNLSNVIKKMNTKIKLNQNAQRTGTNETLPDEKFCTGFSGFGVRLKERESKMRRPAKAIELSTNLSQMKRP